MTEDLNFATTILRHCVPSGADGLSPLQRQTIDCPKKVRVFSAPTGSGKSYAFQRAIVERPQTRVLFIVPTRRLVQNLADSLIEELVKAEAAKSRDEAAQTIALWSSDERTRLEHARPDLKVGRLRVQELRGWDEGQARRMIFATPESVAWLLFRPDRSVHGATPV
ncbi:MAG: DEAD/DEAH box helicase family protein, partial [Hyphomicrobiaceae bacterium]